LTEDTRDGQSSPYQEEKQNQYQSEQKQNNNSHNSCVTFHHNTLSDHHSPLSNNNFVGFAQLLHNSSCHPTTTRTRTETKNDTNITSVQSELYHTRELSTRKVKGLLKNYSFSKNQRLGHLDQFPKAHATTTQRSCCAFQKNE